MPYSDKDLTVIESKRIADALLECDSILMPERRFQILNSIRQSYPAINVDNADPSSIGLELVRLCQQYEGALEELINIMECLYEGQRDNPEAQTTKIKKLNQCLQEIFSPLPPPHASLRIEVNGDFTLTISGVTNTISKSFSNSYTIDFKIARPYMWKQLHTYSEQLLNDFMDIYEFIVNDKQTVNDKIKRSRLTLARFRQYNCENFLEDMNRLDQNILNLPQLRVLMLIPQCIDAILETMQEPLSHEYFLRGQSLARHIKYILFESLRIADRSLEYHLTPR